MQNRAQGAVEYLLIIGAAILVVSIVVMTMVTITSTGKENTNEETATTALNPLQQLKDQMVEGESCWDETLTLNPLPICNVQDLDKIKLYPSENFELKNDIEASTTSKWNDGEGFLPIGLNCLDTSCGDADSCENEIGCESTWYTGPTGCAYNPGSVCDWDEWICTNYCGGNYDWDFSECVDATSEPTCSTSKDICENVCYDTWYEQNTCEYNPRCTTKESCERPYGCGSEWYDTFTGTLDGNGHTIANLSINRNKYYTGLFGITNGATIKNTAFTNAKITGLYMVGGLIGQSANTTIDNIIFQGEVNGTASFVGGITGYSTNPTINNVSFQGNINSSGDNTGGIAGYQNNGTTQNSSFQGQVKSTSNYVGGIAGQKDGGTITKVNSGGNIITTSSFVGGLFGYNSRGTLSSSYSTADINGANYAGGAIGINQNNTTLSNIYSTGIINGTGSYIGGLIGYMYGSNSSNIIRLNTSYSTGKVYGTGTYVNGLVGYRNNSSYTIATNCFFDSQTSEKTNGSNITTGITGRTTAQMKTQSTFTGWDFTNTWQIVPTTNNGYPSLK